MFAAAASQAQVDPKSFEGKQVPAFTMKDLNGKTVSKENLKGKVVLLDFWATWCGPCIQASPLMQKLHAKYAKKGLTVVGVNVSDAPGAAAKYKQKHKYGYTFTTGGEELQRKMGVTGIPAFIFIDKKGVVSKVQIGFAPSVEAAFENAVKTLLAKK